MRGRQRAKRKRREDELEEEHEPLQEAEPEQKVSAPPSLADKALDLQKTAGNRAVGAALDRWALPWVPQTAPPVAKWPKEAQAVFDGKLVVPIQSVGELAQTQAVGGRSGQAKHGDPEGEGELVIVAAIGDHIVVLHKAMLEGKTYGKVEIIIPGPNGTGVRYELENVYITSYSTSSDPHGGGGTQSYQLSYSKRKFSNTPPPPRG